MRLSYHRGVSQLTLLSLALLCPIPWPVTARLLNGNGSKLEPALFQLQAALKALKNPKAWAPWPQDPWKDDDGEHGFWEEEEPLRVQRGDLLGWPRSPFPGGYSQESAHYQNGGEGEDGGKRNKALHSIAGGLQAVSREKGGFGFRFGRKRRPDRGWRDEGRGSQEEDKWRVFSGKERGV